METTASSPTSCSPACALCAADVIHCHEVSVEHADGATECVDPWCNLPHHLHEWQLACDAIEPPCPCATVDGPLADGAAAHPHLAGAEPLGWAA